MQKAHAGNGAHKDTRIHISLRSASLRWDYPLQVPRDRAITHISAFRRPQRFLSIKRCDHPGLGYRRSDRFISLFYDDMRKTSYHYPILQPDLIAFPVSANIIAEQPGRVNTVCRDAIPLPGDCIPYVRTRYFFAFSTSSGMYFSYLSVFSIT